MLFSTSKCKFSDLPLFALKFTNFLMSFLEPRVSFSSNIASLFSVMRHNSSALFHLNLCMLWTKGSDQSANFWLLLWKLTKFLMSFFKPRVSFQLNFATPFSVMTHNSSEIFKHYMLWKKRVHQCTIFQTFWCSNESSPNLLSHFWNHKARTFWKFASLFSVMKDNSSVFFLAQTSYSLDKNSPSKWNFQTFSGWVKIHQIPYVIFETASQFFINFASLFNAMRDKTHVLF